MFLKHRECSPKVLRKYFLILSTMAGSVEDVLVEHETKLEQLTIATTLIQNKKVIASELSEVQESTFSLLSAISSAKSDLKELRKKNVELVNLVENLKKLNNRISHMENNIPPQLLYDYANVVKEREYIKAPPNMQSTHSLEIDSLEDVFEETSRNSVKDCKKTLFNEPEIFPRLRLISTKEFDLIPKYMIGRQSLDTINRFVSTINDVLKAKYSLLALGKNGAKKKGELNLYMHYKMQESVDTGERVYFFTAEDYQNHTTMKLDKTKLNLLTVLRHCKRLCNPKGAKTAQYTVITT
ncbi:spindle and kinetochore-associated protein 1-like [Neodiprion virginianus]|uniref:spindle and kinetochore-associated protein 1-like n=1 Tax=Neodiprion virginianus TaxID=2961670 RepID=UPI001EE6D54F|nr:spindle and kinetochore-associated protein 1-like [Neodiprion virginianus]